MKAQWLIEVFKNPDGLSNKIFPLVASVSITGEYNHNDIYVISEVMARTKEEAIMKARMEAARTINYYLLSSHAVNVKDQT